MLNILTLKPITMKNKIPENWAAIEAAENQVKEIKGDPEARFNATTFWLGGEGRHLMLPIMYRGKKGKKEQEQFTKKYSEIMIYAKFCPFTGKPLYEDSVELVNAENNNILKE